jgi:cyclopropane-fatty-acyl-phospholipid synthase
MAGPMTVTSQPPAAPPSTATPPSTDARVDEAARALALLVRAFGDGRDFAIRFWDGRALRTPGGVPPRFTLVIRHPGALRRMLLPPTDLAIGEAYVRGDFDIEGDLFAAVALPDRLGSVALSPLGWLRTLSRLARLPDGGGSAAPTGRAPAALGGERHSRQRDSDAIRYHYDVGNEFYALWLDERMVYSCAYFRRAEATLDEAQLAKLDLVLDKLGVRDGHRLLDIGCGWGGLLIRAAERFDVEAVGITLSPRQHALATEHIAAAGLSDRCRVELLDYRDAPARLGRFDRIASVGMAEHVGRARLAEYFATARQSLTPGGLFLNHAITQQPARTVPPGLLFGGPLRRVIRDRSFIDAYVFPDGELLPVGEMLDGAADAGFAVHHVESLRPHYALTLRHWVARLEARWDDAVAAAGEAVARTWRLYMTGAAVGFEASRLDVHQMLLALPRPDGSSDAPLTPTWS